MRAERGFDWRRIPPALWIMILMCALSGAVAPGFFSLGNLANVVMQAAPLLIVSLGVTMVILTEGIDLSVGFVMGFVGVVVSLVLKTGTGFGPALLAGLAAGTACGLVSGVLVAHLKLPPFIVTLGMGIIYYGLGLVLTNGASIQALHPSLAFLTAGKVLGLNASVVIAAVVFGLCWVAMHETVFGRNVVALGGNPEALRVTGIRTRNVLAPVYGVAGLLSAVAGLLIASRTGSGYAAAAVGWDFDAIGATIIGGTSFEEGKGGIERTVLGVFLISILRNGLNVAGVHNMYQFALIGAVLLGTIVLDVKFRQAVEDGRAQA